MGEIRVICPACRAEYRLPQDAIPEAGREVECTSCGRIWNARNPALLGAPKARRQAVEPQQAPRPEPESRDPSSAPERLSYKVAFGAASTVQRDPATAATEPPKPSPATVPLDQRVAKDVLDILRDEVAHERRARQAEQRADRRSAPAAPPSRPAPVSPDADWPATTVTVPAAQASGPQAAPPEPAASRPLPPKPPRASLPDHEAAQSGPVGHTHASQHAQQPRAEAISPAAQDDEDRTTAPTPPGQDTAKADEPADTDTGSEVPAKPADPGHSAYLTGLGLAAMVAAVCVALYLLAPGMADDGSFGAAMGDYRQMVDEARLWLRDTLRGLIG